MKPLCFILMPFGKKPGPAGTLIDFDRVYADLIVPAVQEADLEPLRADEEAARGNIHKPMLERLILCPVAVADLTLANANLFYDLGRRHGFRPSSTVPIIAEENRLPLEIEMLRTIQYKLGPDGAPDPAALSNTRQAISKMLIAARDGSRYSPIFQLINDLPLPVRNISHEKTDVFRQEVEYSNELKDKLAAARQNSTDAVREAEKELGKIADVESGVAIDLMLSYRARSAWTDMVALIDKMSPPLRETVMVREQLALGLNRLKRRNEAEAVILKVIQTHGPSSESYAILGRVYKDAWEDTLKSGDETAAGGYLEKAIAAYLSGFEADSRDAFSGINAVTLMEIKDPPDERRKELVPVVRYAVGRKIAKGKPDYWDYATLVELAVLGLEPADAKKSLAQALAIVRESWEPETTARNLRIIREARERRGQSPDWARAIEDTLLKKAGK